MPRDARDALNVQYALNWHTLPLRNGLRRQPANLLSEAGIAPGDFLGFEQCGVHESNESITFP